MSERFMLVKQDAVAFLKLLESGSVDCLITDPAYESLEKHRAVGTTTRLSHSNGSSNDWFQIFPNTRFPEFFRECYRVLKKNAHLYLFCDAETMFIAKPVGEAAGFKFWKPLVWDKLAIGMGYHYRARCEFILFFEKGKRKLLDLGIADVLDTGESVVIAEKRVWRGYPTEKSIKVCETLILQSTLPGELVVDPFFGSGTTGAAAVRRDRRFHGSDISQDAYEHALKRIQAEITIMDPPADEATEEAPI